MSILDIFKNKETLDNSEMQKLQKEIVELQKLHDQEKENLVKNYEDVKNEWEKDKNNFSEIGKKHEEEKQRCLDEIFSHIRKHIQEWWD